VSLGDKLAYQILAFRNPQVSGNAALVAGADGPPQRILPATPLPHGIAGSGRFNLNDVSAEIREQLSAEGPGYQLAEFDDPQVGERAFSLACHRLPPSRDVDSVQARSGYINVALDLSGLPSLSCAAGSARLQKPGLS